MAKAHITTKGGTKITVEGSPAEVASLVAQIRGGSSAIRHRPSQSVSKRKSQIKATPINLIAELIDGGFFRKPKELSLVKLALEEQGHYYPATTLSPALLRHVRKRNLRRIKDKKRWLYVQ